MKVQISQGPGPLFQIELLKPGRVLIATGTGLCFLNQSRVPQYCVI